MHCYGLVWSSVLDLEKVFLQSRQAVLLSHTQYC